MAAVSTDPRCLSSSICTHHQLIIENVWTTSVFSALIAELLSTYQNSQVAVGLNGFLIRVYIKPS